MFSFPNGMTVAELKRVLTDWPDTDSYGEENQVWVADKVGLSNQVTVVTSLNERDLLLEIA